jgi:hypothetical protein
MPGADGDLLARKLNTSPWLGLKSAVPARWLVIPGPDEGSPLDNHDPHPGVAVLGPGTDAEDLGLGKLPEYRLRESSCGRHFLNRGRFAVGGPNAAELVRRVTGLTPGAPATAAALVSPPSSAKVGALVPLVSGCRWFG